MRNERNSIAETAAVGLLVLTLAGCSGEALHNVPTVQVHPAKFEIRIQARGELKAANSTKIDIPTTLQGMQRIAWLAAESVPVVEGDLVAVLDGEELERRVSEIENNLVRIGAQLLAKQGELDKERRGLDSQLTLLSKEKENAERFAPRDERIYSRHEILNAQADLELIGSKIEHFQSRAGRYAKRAEAELQILDLQRKTETVKQRQLSEALANLEIRAPHDGFLLHGKTWQGEKMRVGMSVWPGMSLGELPDVSEMEAKIHVLESEAAGLADGLECSVLLDAHPDQEFKGTVKSVQPVANPIEQDSPVKYFEVLLSLSMTETAIMKPASQVQATILVAQENDSLSVPNQAIFHEGDETWVWVTDGGAFRKVPVTLGRRSISRTIVDGGLESGQRIALVDPMLEDAG